MKMSPVMKKGVRSNTFLVKHAMVKLTQTTETADFLTLEFLYITEVMFFCAIVSITQKYTNKQTIL